MCRVLMLNRIPRPYSVYTVEPPTLIAGLRSFIQRLSSGGRLASYMVPWPVSFIIIEAGPRVVADRQTHRAHTNR